MSVQAGRWSMQGRLTAGSTDQAMVIGLRDGFHILRGMGGKRCDSIPRGIWYKSGNQEAIQFLKIEFLR